MVYRRTILRLIEDVLCRLQIIHKNCPTLLRLHDVLIQNGTNRPWNAPWNFESIITTRLETGDTWLLYPIQTKNIICFSTFIPHFQITFYMGHQNFDLTPIRISWDFWRTRYTLSLHSFWPFHHLMVIWNIAQVKWKVNLKVFLNLLEILQNQKRRVENRRKGKIEFEMKEEKKNSC